MDDITTIALCQMHIVSIEEKCKRLDKFVGPSEKDNTKSTSRQEEKTIRVKKGKEKLSSTYKLALTIE
jgi:hypothetical protein